jgi:hypothetical protein
MIAGPPSRASAAPAFPRGPRDDVAAGHPDVVARMKAAMSRWQESVRRSQRGGDYPK